MYVHQTFCALWTYPEVLALYRQQNVSVTAQDG